MSNKRMNELNHKLNGTPLMEMASAQTAMGELAKYGAQAEKKMQAAVKKLKDVDADLLSEDAVIEVIAAAMDPVVKWAASLKTSEPAIGEAIIAAVVGAAGGIAFTNKGIDPRRFITKTGWGKYIPAGR